MVYTLVVGKTECPSNTMDVLFKNVKTNWLIWTIDYKIHISTQRLHPDHDITRSFKSSKHKLCFTVSVKRTMAFVWGRLKICPSDTMSVLFNDVRTRLVLQDTEISRYLAVYLGLLRFFGSSSRTSRAWRNNQEWIVTYEFGKILDCEIGTTEFPLVTW